MTQKIINNLYLSDNDITTSYYNQLSHKDKRAILNNQNHDKGFILNSLDFMIKAIIQIIFSIVDLFTILIIIGVSSGSIYLINKLFEGMVTNIVDETSGDAFRSTFNLINDLMIDLYESNFIFIIIRLIEGIAILMVILKIFNVEDNQIKYKQKPFNFIYQFLYNILIKPFETIKLISQSKTILKNITNNEESMLLNQLNTRYYDLDNKKVILLHQIMCDAEYDNDYKQYAFNTLPEFDHYISERLINFSLTEDQKELIELLELYIQNSELKKENIIRKLKNELKITKLNNKKQLLDYYNSKNEQISSQLKEIYENADDVEFIKARYDLLK